MSSMRTISFSLPVRERSGSEWKVSTTIEVDEKRYDVWYSSKQGPIADGVESFLAACIVPAMGLGYAVKAPAPVSGRLLNGIAHFQNTMHEWFPELLPVPILAEAKATTTVRAAGVGSFFSCGVDACYSMLKHYDEITQAVLIHGFDFPATHALSCETVSQMAEKATRKLKKPLLEVSTNIREFGRHKADWLKTYHGSILASVALLLSPQLGTMYLPSTYPTTDLFPWGSHPDIDPLWSTEGIDIVHDGCEASRTQKVARIAQSDVAMSVLRVCGTEFKTRGTAFNCGKCEKCIRTMVDLRIAGALERTTTFRRCMTLRDVKLVDMRKGMHRYFYQSSLDEITRKGNDPKLAAALRECLSGRHYRGVEGACRDITPHLKKGLLRPFLRPFERTTRWVRSPFQQQV